MDEVYSRIAECLMDEVYSRIVELVIPEQILVSDLQIHPACFLEYMYKWKAANQKDMHSENVKVFIVSKLEIFKHHSKIIRTVSDQGKGLSLSEIRDTINNKEEFNLDIKCFLLEEFGDSIKFCNLERKNKSQFVFSSLIQLDDVVNSVCSMNVVKTAAVTIREVSLNVDFKLDDRFCNTQGLKESWKTAKYQRFF